MKSKSYNRQLSYGKKLDRIESMINEMNTGSSAMRFAFEHESLELFITESNGDFRIEEFDSVNDAYFYTLATHDTYYWM